MISFAHTAPAAEHSGVARAIHAAGALKCLAGVQRARQLLWAGSVTALLALFSQALVPATEWEGPLLAVGMLAWIAVLAIVPLWIKPVRRLRVSLRQMALAWRHSRRQAAEEDRLWKAMLQEARAMAELNRAMNRACGQ